MDTLNRTKEGKIQPIIIVDLQIIRSQIFNYDCIVHVIFASLFGNAINYRKPPKLLSMSRIS